MSGRYLHQGDRAASAGVWEFRNEDQEPVPALSGARLDLGWEENGKDLGSLTQSTRSWRERAAPDTQSLYIWYLFRPQEPEFECPWLLSCLQYELGAEEYQVCRETKARNRRLRLKTGVRMLLSEGRGMATRSCMCSLDRPMRGAACHPGACHACRRKGKPGRPSKAAEQQLQDAFCGF